MKNKIILFMPHIGIGGVEKIFSLFQIFLQKNRKDVVVITISKNSKKFLSKNINFVTLNFNFWQKLGKKIKIYFSLSITIERKFLSIRILWLLAFKQMFIVVFYQNYLVLI